MGTIAVTVAPANSGRKPQHIGQRLQWDGVIPMSTSYATGGDTLKASALGMNKISGGIIGEAGLNGYQLIPQTDGSAKIKAIVRTTGAEVASTTDLSGVTNIYAMIIGT